MPQYPTPSTNSIRVSTEQSLEHEFEAYGTIMPGDVVEFVGGGDCRIRAGTDGSDTIIGVAVLAHASVTGRGSQRTSGYTTGDQVKVISGPVTVMLRLKAGEQIDCGDHLKAAPSGEVQEYTCATDNSCQLLAQALVALAQDTVNMQWLLCRWLKG